MTLFELLKHFIYGCENLSFCINNYRDKTNGYYDFGNLIDYKDYQVIDWWFKVEDEKLICRNSFTERKPKEPHTDKGAIPKPYRKKDHRTRRERLKYEKI